MRVHLTFLLLFLLAVASIAQPVKLIIPKGHSGLVEAVFSPDSKQLLTVGEESNITVWDIRSSRVLDYLEYPKPISHIFFTADGNTLVTVATDATIGYWNWKMRKLIFQTKMTAKPMALSMVSQNKNRLLLVLDNGEMVTYDVKSRRVVRVLKPDPKSKHKGQYAISQDGNYIVSAEFFTGRIDVWNATTGQKFKSIILQEETAGLIKFLSDGTFCYGDNDSMHLYSVPSFQPKVSVEAFDDNNAILLPGDRLATNVNWQAVRRPATRINIIDLKTGNQEHLLKEEHGILDIEVINKKELMSLQDDGVVSFWDLSSGEVEDVIERSTVGMQQQIWMSPNNKLAAVTSTDLFGAFSLAVIDLTSHNIVSQFQKPANLITDIIPNPEANRIVFNEEKSLKCWQIDKPEVKSLGDAAALLGRTTQEIIDWYLKDNPWLSGTEEIGAAFVNWQEQILTAIRAAGDDSLQIWDLQSFSKAESLGYGKEIVTYRYHPANNKILLAFDDSTFCVTTLLDKAVNIPKFHSIGHKISGAKFIPQSSKVFLVTADSLFIYDLLSAQIIDRYDYDPVNDEYFLLGMTGEWLLHDNGEAVQLKNRQPLFTIPGMSGDLWKKISDNDSLVAFQSLPGNLDVYDIKSKKVSVSIPARFGKVNDLAFARNNRWLLASFNDRSTRIFDLLSGKEVAAFTFFGKEDYLIQVPEGYYMGSPGSARQLHYVRNKSIIGFEQLDIRFNRPDLVLQALGSSDSTLIQSYRNAYEKRIRKLGIDPGSFKDAYSVPEAAIGNGDAIKFEQLQPNIPIHIKGGDSTYLLDRFNVWVNDVPVFGVKGVSLRNQKKHFIDTTISITLSQGDNRIETSVLNVNGTESYRSPIFVKYTPLVETETKVYFVGIGINEFENPAFNLTWSLKDIRDLAAKFKAHYGDQLIVDTLFDKEVTRQKVMALKQKLMSLHEDDKVIIAYSGHGVLSSDLDYFLSTWNIDFETPANNGLVYDDLESLLDSIRPRQKLLLIDACHSGEVDKDDVAKIEKAQPGLDSNGITHKSKIVVVAKKKLGMANSFELMQNLFVNVSKGSGATIISAAGGMQYAQERGDLKNGVFTYCILDAFNSNPTLTVSQLKKIVVERVPALTNGLQKPTSRNETLNVDWRVW